MQTSANYDLKLMEGTDNVKRQDFVDNFTTIDTQMKIINDNSYPTVTATGTNDYVGSTDRITALSKGTKLTLFVANDATGNCTFNLNTYGAKSVKDSFGNIVTNLKKDIPYNVCYNGMDFILQGKGGGGDATAAQLLLGKKATVDSGPIVGTLDLTNLVTGNIKSGVTINGIAGKASIVDTADALAVAAQLLSGASAYVNGIKIAGNVPVNPGLISGTNHIQAAAYTYGSYDPDGLPHIYLRPGIAATRQCIDGDVWITQGDANYIAANIIAGKSIFGLAGSATPVSIGGKYFATGTISGTTYDNFRYASGTMTYSRIKATISGLTFTPKFVIAVLGSNITIYDGTYIRVIADMISGDIKQTTNTWMLSSTIAPANFAYGTFTIPLCTTAVYTYYAFGD